jgi:hypothetical protein
MAASCSEGDPMNMRTAIFPLQADNDYHGQRAGLWIFALITALRTIIGVNSTFNALAVATKADGIPVASYPPAAAQTIVSLFSALGVSHLLWVALSVIVLIRYRNLVPFMFTLRLLALLAARIQHQLRPIPTVGSVPGGYVMIIFLALTVTGLALSLWPRAALGITPQNEAMS